MGVWIPRTSKKAQVSPLLSEYAWTTLRRQDFVLTSTLLLPPPRPPLSSSIPSSNRPSRRSGISSSSSAPPSRGSASFSSLTLRISAPPSAQRASTSRPLPFSPPSTRSGSSSTSLGKGRVPFVPSRSLTPGASRLGPRSPSRQPSRPSLSLLPPFWMSCRRRSIEF